MKVQIRKYAVGAVAAGALAAVGALALPNGSADWAPVTYGLTTAPEQIVPATVTEAQPARVVSTTIDADGRPVVTVKEATDKASAIKLVEEAQQADGAVGVEMDAPVYAFGAPTGSDTYRAQQWDIPKIRTADAWQKSTGAGVVVAVIDSGVDATHPDLAGQVIGGLDATTDREGTTTDRHGHGTHVAGTVAAVTGNATGISGVAPDVKIMPVKVLGDNGSGNMSDTAQGITWAADHGAQVINMSLGGTQQVAAVSTAISYARSKGVTVVAAVGNSRQQGSPTSYPAADAGVIGVAATDSNDRIGVYSNAGNYVDVAAPGTDILSLAPGGQYKTMSGTSMASPHVAAVAALMKSYQGSLTPDQIEATLEKSAVDLGGAGFDNDFGNGRIDALAALNALTPATTAPTTPPTKAPTTAPATPPTSAPVTKTPTTPPTSAPVTKTPTSPPATGTPVKALPVITANTAGGEVVHGTATSTTFTVKAGGQVWSRKPVSVCVTETGAAQLCTDAVTDDFGAVRVDRPGKASYGVVLKAAATAANEAATSATVSWKVRAAVTVVPTGWGRAQITLTGAAGRATEIQQKVSGVWRKVGSYTPPASPAKATLTGLVPGQTYRVVIPAGTAILGATSGVSVASSIRSDRRAGTPGSRRGSRSCWSVLLRPLRLDQRDGGGDGLGTSRRRGRDDDHAPGRRGPPAHQSRRPAQIHVRLVADPGRAAGPVPGRCARIPRPLQQRLAGDIPPRRDDPHRAVLVRVLGDLGPFAESQTITQFVDGGRGAGLGRVRARLTARLGRRCRASFDGRGMPGDPRGTGDRRRLLRSGPGRRRCRLRRQRGRFGKCRLLLVHHLGDQEPGPGEHRDAPGDPGRQPSAMARRAVRVLQRRGGVQAPLGRFIVVVVLVVGHVTVPGRSSRPMLPKKGTYRAGFEASTNLSATRHRMALRSYRTTLRSYPTVLRPYRTTLRSYPSV
jgi:serine protease